MFIRAVTASRMLTPSNLNNHMSESFIAKVQWLLKPLLRKYKYPSEGQDNAVTPVLEQGEALANTWSANG